MNLNRPLSSGDAVCPSIDKPWMKYYDEEAKVSAIPPIGLYEYLRQCIEAFPSSAFCLNYYGNRISYRDLLGSIDKVAKAFLGIGIKKGDIVSVVSPTTPEAIYCIYGLNRIGAVANIIDPRFSADNLMEKMESSVTIIGIDLISSKLEKCNQKQIPLFAFSVSESFPFVKRFIYKLKKGRLRSKTLGSWSEFLKLGLATECIDDDSPQDDDVAVMVSTSGTTGKSKLAMLTNMNVNSIAWQYAHSGISHHQGSIFLNVMLLFLSYGIAAGMHMPLCLGFESVLIPRRDMRQVGSYLIRYKPQSYLDIPTSFESLLNSPAIHEGTNLSFLKNPGVGGDHLDPDLEEKVNEFLAAHGCFSPIQKGYGLTEMSSASIVNVNEACNMRGSVGIPLPKTEAKIVDTVSREELPLGEVGELCLSGPALFKGYYGNPAATEQELETDENGKTWVKTGDLFSMNENGELFFLERMKMMFVRPDGHNNHPNAMSEVLRRHPAIKDVCTVGIPSPFHSHGRLPKAVLVVSPEIDDDRQAIQEELERMCLNALSKRDVPCYYEFRDMIPYTSNGKVDFKQLEDEGVGNSHPAKICIEEFYPDGYGAGGRP